MDLKKISQLFKEIGKLNNEEFQQFRAGFLTMDRDRQARRLYEFQIGDLVTFQSSRRKHAARGLIMIKITGRGSKRLVGVEVDPKTRKSNAFSVKWKVPPSFCTKVEEEVTS